MSYIYRTHTINGERGRDVDLDVEPAMDELQDQGWEPVSGPAITEHHEHDDDGRPVTLRDYTFLIRKAEPAAGGTFYGSGQ